MNAELLTQVGVFTPDSLIARVTPPAESFGVEIAALAENADDVNLKRGTVLGRGADGKYAAFGGSAEAKVAEFNGDGTATTFTLTDKPEKVDGVKVGTTDAVISAYNSYTGVVTLSSAPAAGTKNVKVSYTLPTGEAPAAILAEDVTVTDEGDVAAVAYRSGCFNRAAIIGTLIADDEEEMRKLGFRFFDVV